MKFIFSETNNYIWFLHSNVDLSKDLKIEIKIKIKSATFNIKTYINNQGSADNKY